MTIILSLSSPQILHIQTKNGTALGADQEWYGQLWQRQAGCGPTNCSHLLWYLAATRPDCRALVKHDCREAAGFLRLMEDVWQYVKPGRMGVNNTHIFCDGALRYGERHGVKLRCRALEIPTLPFARPKAETMAAFISQALADDLPLAFLNLANGVLTNLDSWHWVTLVAFNPERLTATMYNQGVSSEIDLGLWLRTTTLGGGLVALEPAMALDSPSNP